MADQIDLMLEADKRGLLSPDQKAYLDEAIKRGIVKAVPANIQAQAGQLATDDTPTWQKGLVSLGRGLTDVGQGAKQIYLHTKDALTAPTMSDLVQGNRASDRYDAQVGEEKQLYKPFGDSVSGAGIGEATGAALPTLLIPGGVGGKLVGSIVGKALPAVGARLAGSALTDATVTGFGQGAVMATAPGESRLANAAAGAVGGAGAVLGINAIAKLAGPALQRIVNAVKPADIAKGAFTPESAAALAKEGIDVNSLTDEAKQKLAQMAQDAVVGAPSNPAALARQARLQSLPVPIQASKGVLDKTFEQNQLEQDLLKNNAVGGPLRAQQDDINSKLLQNFDAFKGQTGATATTPGDVGRSVDAAVQSRIDASKANISSLYRTAEQKGELNGPVSLDPLTDYLNKNPGINPYAESQLKSMKLVKTDEAGNLAPNGPISLNDLERVRSRASKVSATSSDGTQRNDARELVKSIDDMIPDDAGGEAYKAARAARTQHALDFEEPKVIQNVVGMASRTDRSTPYEDVFNKTVLNGSIDDLKTLHAQLTATGSPNSTLSARAVNDLKGQTIQYLKDAATNNAQGTTSEAALRRAYNNIGDEKMALLFGDNGAKQLKNFVAAVNDLKVPPTGSGNPSGTAQSLVNWLDRILGTVGGRLGRGAGQAVKNMAANGQAAAQVADAVNPMAATAVANAAAAKGQQAAQLKDLLNSAPVRRGKQIGAALGASLAAQQ